MGKPECTWYLIGRIQESIRGWNDSWVRSRRGDRVLPEASWPSCTRGCRGEDGCSFLDLVEGIWRNSCATLFYAMKNEAIIYWHRKNHFHPLKSFFSQIPSYNQYTLTCDCCQYTRIASSLILLNVRAMLWYLV